MPKTVAELMLAMLDLFPNATLEDDGCGQLIINTGLSCDENDNLHPFDPDTQPEGA